jgi:hypothetical protein
MFCAWRDSRQLIKVVLSRFAASLTVCFALKSSSMASKIPCCRSRSAIAAASPFGVPFGRAQIVAASP